MANSVKSLKSHLKQSPLFAASMEAALLSLYFPLATEMSLDLGSILPVEQFRLCSRVSRADVFLPRGVVVCLTSGWSVWVHSALSLKGLCVYWWLSLVALQLQNFKLSVLASLRSSVSIHLQIA